MSEDRDIVADAVERLRSESWDALADALEAEVAWLRQRVSLLEDDLLEDR